jgi:four helix bundle protein
MEEQIDAQPATKRYDLEDRTFRFAARVRQFVKALPRTMGNLSDSRQVINSSGSMGANYIEANDAISRKDFLHRIRICRKESKETVYWLRLLDIGENPAVQDHRQELVQEATELMRIFAAILRKSE